MTLSFLVSLVFPPVPRRHTAAPLAAFVVLVLAPGAARAAEMACRMAAEPSPVGIVHVARPSIGWGIWPSTAGTRVTNVVLTLNGARVPARYVEAERAVAYEPDDALAPGTYEAHCRVTFNQVWPVEKTWRFTVASGASARLADPDERQAKAFLVANRFRRTLGLPDFSLDSRLCASALAHARYLDQTHGFGHAQQASLPGFVGAGPGERNAAFGFSGGCYEDMSSGVPSVAAPVRGLFDAPYHRIPFLQPGAPAFGAGFAGDNCALEFGMTTLAGANEQAVVVSPCHGETDVALSWDGVETPSPLRVHGDRAGGPVGYPIAFACFAPDSGAEGGPVRLRVSRATLTVEDTSAAVPFLLNTPDNDDHLSNAVLLIPTHPLLAGTTYRVSIQAEADGRDVSRSWTFTTTSRETGDNATRLAAAR